MAHLILLQRITYAGVNFSGGFLIACQHYIIRIKVRTTDLVDSMSMPISLV